MMWRPKCLFICGRLSWRRFLRQILHVLLAGLLTREIYLVWWSFSRSTIMWLHGSRYYPLTFKARYSIDVGCLLLDKGSLILCMWCTYIHSTSYVYLAIARWKYINWHTCYYNGYCVCVCVCVCVHVYTCVFIAICCLSVHSGNP